MTYGEMFKRCTDSIRNEKIADYRPNEKMHTKDLEDRCGIRLWFNNGDSAIYYPSPESFKGSGKDNNAHTKTDRGDCISRKWCLAEYDRRHKGPAGGARKIIEEAPSIE